MAKRSEYGSYRNPMDSGYIRVWCPGHPTAGSDGYALEHRKVAYDAGVLTDLAMHVHHRNGNKADNRIENLEAVDESDHHRAHVAEAGFVTNQFGTFPLASSDEERRERQRASVRRSYWKRKAAG